MMIGFGFVMLFAGKRDKVRQWGSMIMGLGLVFYGMGVMGDSMAPLRSYEPFMDLMVKMEVPFSVFLREPSLPVWCNRRRPPWVSPSSWPAVDW